MAIDGAFFFGLSFAHVEVHSLPILLLHNSLQLLLLISLPLPRVLCLLQLILQEHDVFILTLQLLMKFPLLVLLLQNLSLITLNALLHLFMLRPHLGV